MKKGDDLKFFKFFWNINLYFKRTKNIRINV